MNAATTVVSKNGTVHGVARTYTNQNGGQNVIGSCNKMIHGPRVIENATVTCKPCVRALEADAVGRIQRIFPALYR